jgi:hypothetical protein
VRVTNTRELCSILRRCWLRQPRNLHRRLCLYHTLVQTLFAALSRYEGPGRSIIDKPPLAFCLINFVPGDCSDFI